MAEVTPTDIIMLDKAFNEIAARMEDELSYMDKCFGRAERLTQIVNGKRVMTPNIYVGNKAINEYYKLLPDSGIGCFSFFVVDDPMQIQWEQFVAVRTTAPFSLIVWLDLRKVFDSQTLRNLDFVKAQFITLLNGRKSGKLISNGRITINRIYERAENIFKGFTLDEVDNQFLMHPFAGFRFEGTIAIDTPCQVSYGVSHIDFNDDFNFDFS